MFAKLRGKKPCGQRFELMTIRNLYETYTTYKILVAPCYFLDLRSNFNSRGVNSRELFCFFGHSSLSHHAFLMKIGGNASYKPPGPP